MRQTMKRENSYESVIAKLRALEELFSNYKDGGTGPNEEASAAIAWGNGLLIGECADQLEEITHGISKKGRSNE